MGIVGMQRLRDTDPEIEEVDIQLSQTTQKANQNNSNTISSTKHKASRGLRTTSDEE